MKLKLLKNIKEDAPTNAAGGGNIAGIGVGPDGEPGKNNKRKKEYEKRINLFTNLIKRNSK